MKTEFRNPDFDDLASEGKRQWSADEKPLPLRRKMSEPEPFPLVALGDALLPVALRVQQAIQAPDALCGQSILAAACFAAQAHADVEVDGRRSPISENFVTVGESGERKSTIDRVANRAGYQREMDLRVEDQIARAAYKIEKDAYEAQYTEIMKKRT